MPNLEVKLVWALPVKVDKLGAHVQAYFDTLSMLNTLRLCNRFGKGPKATITKLPIELVDRIQAFVDQAERKQALQDWMKELRCCERTCEPADHFSMDEIREEYYSGGHGWECACCSPDSDVGSDGELIYASPKKLRSKFNSMERDDLGDGTFERCFNNRMNWSQRMLYFHDKGALFRAHFGLEIWTSAVRLDNPNHEYEEVETTVAYLTLPGTTGCRKSWEASQMELESGDIRCESGYGMPVELDTAKPAPNSLARFRRALNILRLQVFEHPSQKCPTLSSISANLAPEDGAITAAKRWPGQTLLVKSVADIQ